MTRPFLLSPCAHDSDRIKYELSHVKMALRYFLSEMRFCILAKTNLSRTKSKKKKPLQKSFSHSQDRSFSVGGHTLRLTAGRAFGCLFLENQLAGLTALFSCDSSHNSRRETFSKGSFICFQKYNLKYSYSQKIGLDPTPWFLHRNKI